MQAIHYLAGGGAGVGEGGESMGAQSAKKGRSFAQKQHKSMGRGICLKMPQDASALS